MKSLLHNPLYRIELLLIPLRVVGLVAHTWAQATHFNTGITKSENQLLLAASYRLCWQESRSIYLAAAAAASVYLRGLPLGRLVGWCDRRWRLAGPAPLLGLWLW